MARSEYISYNTTTLKHVRNWKIVIIPKLHRLNLKLARELQVDLASLENGNSSLILDEDCLLLWLCVFDC